MNSLPDVTLVTACYNFHHIHPGARSIEEMKESITGVLDIPVYMFIYCDRLLSSFITKYRNELGMQDITIIYELDFENIWAYSLLQKVKENREAYWPTRDARTNAETHIIQFNKFDFVEEVMIDNPFSTKHFAWMDSCLNLKISKICEDYSHSKILYLLNNITDKFHIQILNVCDKKFKNPEIKKEYYKQYRWVVCGGFFTCGQQVGIPILKRLKQIVTETVLAGYGHGEEMFYLEILDEFYNDIVRSYGDYGQIIDNFIQPNKNLEYILHFIIYNYSKYGYHRECYDCCHKLIDAFDNFTIKENYYVWVETYFYYYISALYYKQHESKQIKDTIYKICEKNLYFKKEFDKKRNYYESQF